MSGHDEERIAELLGALPPPPEAWVRAAQELPFARAELDEIVARAVADEEFRRELDADLSAALARAGYEPTEPLVLALREQLARLVEP